MVVAEGYQGVEEGSRKRSQADNLQSNETLSVPLPETVLGGYLVLSPPDCHVYKGVRFLNFN